MSNASASGGGGIGFGGMLAVLFIGLKLTGYITWSWWWVLSPLWIAALVLAVLCVLIVAVSVIAAWGKS